MSNEIGKVDSLYDFAMQMLTRFILMKEAHMNKLTEEQAPGEEDMTEYYLDMDRDGIVGISTTDYFP